MPNDKPSGGRPYETPHSAKCRRHRGAALPLRDRPIGKDSPIALRAASQSELARPDLHHRGADAVPRLGDLRHAVRHQRRTGTEAANGGGLYAVGRWPYLPDQAAGRAQVPQRRAGPCAGLRPQPGPLGGSGQDGSDGVAVCRPLRGTGRPHAEDRSSATAPDFYRGDRPRKLRSSLYNARAYGEDRSVQADNGYGRVGSVPVPSR